MNASATYHLPITKPWVYHSLFWLSYYAFAALISLTLVIADDAMERLVNVPDQMFQPNQIVVAAAPGHLLSLGTRRGGCPFFFTRDSHQVSCLPRPRKSRFQISAWWHRRSDISRYGDRRIS